MAIIKLRQSINQFQNVIVGYKELAANSEASVTEKEQEILLNSTLTMFIGAIVTVLVVIISIVVSLVTSNLISRPVNDLRKASEVFGRQCQTGSGRNKYFQVNILYLQGNEWLKIPST